MFIIFAQNNNFATLKTVHPRSSVYSLINALNDENILRKIIKWCENNVILTSDAIFHAR